MAENTQIRILITGGTLDKEYDQIKGALGFHETHLPEMLDRVKCRLPIELETVLLNDSLDMTDDDREVIRCRCHSAAEDRLIVTHGTDTMTETAAVLGQAGGDKTIILTGAMVPYSFGHSDALFNLGAAITAVQLLDAGVYITMNGKVFSWDNVLKNKEAGVFETQKGEG